jgi:hypothetical protein
MRNLLSPRHDDPLACDAERAIAVFECASNGTLSMRNACRFIDRDVSMRREDRSIIYTFPGDLTRIRTYGRGRNYHYQVENKPYHYYRGD